MAGIGNHKQGKTRTSGKIVRTANSSESNWLSDTKLSGINLMKKRLRLLCADDADTCELITAMLGISDVEVKSVYTVADAWLTAQTEAFDLFLLETRLPDGNGFDLCRRLSKLAPRTPIVFNSCEAYPIDRQKGLAAGAAAYLVKPYFGDFAAAILQIIKTNGKPPLITPRTSSFNRQRRIAA